MSLNIPEQIKITRKTLRESQLEFGNRFGVTLSAVSLWEKGLRQAPYEVIEFVIENKFVICDKCSGKGYINK